VILALADTLAIDAAHRYPVTPMASPGSWGLEMDLLATGSAHAWLAGLLAGGDQAALARLADEADPETAPLFLPYLLPGEHGARWDPGGDRRRGRGRWSGGRHRARSGTDPACPRP
jgi:xylulokinase